MMERRMIAASFVEEALDSLRRRGLPTAPALAAAGLPETVADPVSPQSYGAMWLAIAAALDDEFFGLAGRPMRPGSFTLLCHCVLHARTLGQALRRALRFLRVALDDPYGELTVANGLASVTLIDAGPPRSAFAYRTFWLIVVGVICWLVGRRIPLRSVDFRGEEPNHCADYRQLFGAPVRFGQPASRLAFDARHLALPTKRDEASLRHFLRGAPANILIRYAYDQGLAAAVRRRLRALPPGEWPDLTALARQLKMPASTLRHRLQQEGQTYRAIRDALRQELALQWLAEGRLGVADIAAELGFAEPSAFHRAFRKWTGATPRAYRREGGDVRALGPGR
jgi:AraC-like DNA-binding protein